MSEKRTARLTATRFARAGDILADCLDLAPEERAAFVARATEGEPELLSLVTELLRAAALGGTFLDGGVPGEQAREIAEALVDSAPGSRGGDREADRVAGYEIVEALGSGGFGTVWLARQLEPVRRDVALKVLKPGMDTRDIVARFEQERQALARMSHENIARVLDAGVTESGRPFFGMELVRGRPITRYCDEERLDVRARLRLFVEACRGVQHAHQRGIIHRDIKPSNVLVTAEGGRPIPKVIDFGIAKAIEGDPEDRLVRTQHGEVLGTPAYMSPEQATPGAVADTRTDVYSLGVLLYELLTGMLPFDSGALTRASPRSSSPASREVEAPRPSDRLRSLITSSRGRAGSATPPPAAAGDRSTRSLVNIARARATEPGALRREIRGDLDWIVTTAMANEPERRYPTVDALVADVERHLDHAPVHARPPSATYRVGKFARKHRFAVAAAAVSLILLMGGLLGTSYGLAAANRARGVAEERRARAEEQAYSGAMLLAEQAIVARRLGAARALLDSAPKDLRGWEWSHLAGRLDERVSVLIPPGRTMDALVVDHQDPPRAWSWDASGLQTWTEDPHGIVTPGEVRQVGVPGYLWEAADETMLAVDKDRRVLRMDRSGDVTELPPLHERLWCACLDPALEQAYWFEPDAAVGARRASEVAVRHGRSRLPTGALADCGISPDGARLFVALHYDFFVIDAATLEITHAMSWPVSRELAKAAVSPDGSMMAMGYADGTVELRDFAPADLPLRAILPGGTAWVGCLAWSADGRYVAAGFGDGSTRVWETANGRLLDTLALVGDPVRQVAFLGRNLLVAAADRGLVAWMPGADDHRRLRGHASYVYSVAVLNGGDLAVSAGWDGRAGASRGVKWWDLRSRELVASWGEQKWSDFDVVTTPDGSRVVVAEQKFPDSRVTVLDARTGQLARTFDLPAAGIVHLAMLDARTVVAMDGGGGGRDTGQVLLLDLEAGTTRQLPDPGLTGGFSEADRALAVSPDGQWLALSWGRGGIQIRDASTLAIVTRREVHDAATWSLAFSPDGRHLASTSDDGTLAISAVPSLELEARLRGSSSPVMCAAWTPDGSRLAAGTRDGAIELWDPTRALLVGRLTGHATYVKSVAWTPDGKTLLSASGDHEVRSWDLASAADVAQAAVLRDALLARLQPEVDARLAASGDAGAVARWIDEDAAMTQREREVARQALLRRGLEGAR